jgi:glycosyltransferase involved in cell wall biosynthesis
VTSLLLDISRLFHRRLLGRVLTGIDRVSLEYVRHYGGRARAVLGVRPFFSVLSRPESGRAFRAVLDPGEGAQRDLATLIMRAYVRWWGRADVTDSVLLNTSHTGLESAGYASSLRRRGARPVFFVHDLIPITHSEYCRPGEGERHANRMRTAVTAGRGIIVASRHTLATLGRFCDEAGLPLPPAVIAPLASSLPRADAAPRPLSQPYFVVIGTIEARKNLVLLLELWRDLVERSSAQAPRLVLFGQRGYGCGPAVALLGRRELQEHVLELGPRSDREIAGYLRHAQALLFPSFEEGYGLPLAEALSLGVPAIANDLPAFREIAGDIPEYAGPRDSRRWSDLIADYARPDSALRAAQLQRLAGFRATTWEGHFEQVDAFLHELQIQGTSCKVQGTA